MRSPKFALVRKPPTQTFWSAGENFFINNLIRPKVGHLPLHRLRSYESKRTANNQFLVIVHQSLVSWWWWLDRQVLIPIVSGACFAFATVSGIALNMILNKRSKGNTLLFMCCSCLFCV